MCNNREEIYKLDLKPNPNIFSKTILTTPSLNVNKYLDYNINKNNQPTSPLSSNTSNSN